MFHRTHKSITHDKKKQNAHTKSNQVIYNNYKNRGYMTVADDKMKVTVVRGNLRENKSDLIQVEACEAERKGNQ